MNKYCADYRGSVWALRELLKRVERERIETPITAPWRSVRTLFAWCTSKLSMDARSAHQGEAERG